MNKKIFGIVSISILIIGTLILAVKLAGALLYKEIEVVYEPVPVEVTTIIEETTAEETTAETTAEVITETEPEVTTAEETTEEIIMNAFPLDTYEFTVACRIVHGESGNQDLFGRALVAQCLRQACFDYNDVPSHVAKWLQYNGWADTYDDVTEEAVRAVFYEGYTPSDSKIKYFYAPKYCTSAWHETQHFVIEHGDHRFFEEW